MHTSTTVAVTTSYQSIVAIVNVRWLPQQVVAYVSMWVLRNGCYGRTIAVVHVPLKRHRSPFRMVLQYAKLYSRFSELLNIVKSENHQWNKYGDLETLLMQSIARWMQFNLPQWVGVRFGLQPGDTLTSTQRHHLSYLHFCLIIPKQLVSPISGHSGNMHIISELLVGRALGLFHGHGLFSFSVFDNQATIQNVPFLFKFTGFSNEIIGECGWSNKYEQVYYGNPAKFT